MKNLRTMSNNSKRRGRGILPLKKRLTAVQHFRRAIKALKKNRYKYKTWHPENYTGYINRLEA
jgi:hypothetical protein